jgi:hypothetical protein
MGMKFCILHTSALPSHRLTSIGLELSYNTGMVIKKNSKGTFSSSGFFLS